MKLSAPKFITWFISLLLGVLGILLYLNVLAIPFLTPYIFWLVVAGFGLLILATLFKGL